MNQAAEVSPKEVLRSARRLRAEIKANLHDLRSSHKELRRKVAEVSVRCEGAKQAIQTLSAELRIASSFPNRTPPSLTSLSPRQRRVLEEVVGGKANKAIAFELGVSEKTIESHRARAMEKLHARSFAELVRISVRAGIDSGNPTSDPDVR